MRRDQGRDYAGQVRIPAEICVVQQVGAHSMCRHFSTFGFAGQPRSTGGHGLRPAPAVTIIIDPADVEWSAIRAQGAGGQNVNKVSTAVHLRFDIKASSLPETVKALLLAHGDQRISSDGVVVIKAQRYRSQERNREDAIARLQQLVDAATTVQRARKPTRPTRSSQRRRVEGKLLRGRIKATRGRVDE